MSPAAKGKNNQSRPPDAREKDALFCLSLFVHRYFVSIYGDLSLDLVSLSLLNEIAQHNLEPLANSGRPQFPLGPEQMKLMRGCNAFSLSQATGVPRETVRRKIKQLVELGLVEPHNRKGLFITARWLDRLSHEQQIGILSEFLETAGQIGKLLRD